MERKGGYNQLCDIWATGITAIGKYNKNNNKIFCLYRLLHHHHHSSSFICRIGRASTTDVRFASDAGTVSNVKEWL